MLFNSLEFLIFFPIVVVLYFAFPKKIKQFWLLIASYYFYMCWNAKYIFLIFFSTVITYCSGLLLERIKGLPLDEKRYIRYKKITIAAGFLLNLLVLCYFKYMNYFFSVIAAVFRAAHIELNVPAFDILLPVGISFYTFQALGYMMDVYRNEIHAEKNFFKYALFVSFFPQLVAGPIERSKNLLGQLDKPQKFSFEAAREGLLLMLWGFFLKIVLADRIALFVDTVYGDSQTYGGGYLIVATMLFAVQVYCDFYGYSVIAAGGGQSAGNTFDGKFPGAVFCRFRRRVLEKVAYFADFLVQRLSVYSSGWEPQGKSQEVHKFNDGIFDQRTVAWGQYFLYNLGRYQWSISNCRRDWKTCTG